MNCREMIDRESVPQCVSRLCVRCVRALCSDPSLSPRLSRLALTFGTTFSQDRVVHSLSRSDSVIQSASAHYDFDTSERGSRSYEHAGERRKEEIDANIAVP